MEDASNWKCYVKKKFPYPSTAPSSAFRLLFNVLPVISSLMSKTMHLSQLLLLSHCNQTDAVAIVWLPQESSPCMPHEIS